MLRRVPLRLVASTVGSRAAVPHHFRLACIKTSVPQHAPRIKSHQTTKRHLVAGPSNPPPRTGRDWNAIHASSINFIKWTLVSFLALHIGVEYFYLGSGAYGISMLPTLNSSGDWLWISKYYRRGRGIEVGDVVSFQHPVREGDYAVKRVMGLEGDFVLMNTPGKSDAMIQIPEGHCWVVGDNLPHSRDSRMFGPLPLALIAGKVVARVTTDGLPTWSWLDQGLQDSDESDSVVD